MTPKEYLSQLNSDKKQIDKLLEKKEVLFSRSTKTTHLMMGERVQTSGKCDMVADNVIKSIEIDEKIDALVDDHIYRKHDIINQIQALWDVNYMQVLFKVYVQGMDLKTAAKQMNKSYAYVKELHRKALIEFGKLHSCLLEESD